MTQDALASARATYNLPEWSDGYFEIDGGGELIAKPRRGTDGVSIPLTAVADAARGAGLRLPILVRFVDILRDRSAQLDAAFREAMRSDGFRGGYTAVYPIKVNQHQRVVEEILASGAGDVGLEAGSKPELMAILAVAPKHGRVICNGYKDREYVRLALRARQLGLDCRIVVEKASEIGLILSESERLGITPALGLRVRLASIGEGKWQNTGGEKSKFGLSAAQALSVVERLREAGRLASLDLLHFHLGSQIPNIGDIQRGMREAARYYAELRALGAPVACVDVGGGLGVDYEGTRSRSFCSMNYTMGEYARNIVHTLAEVCDAEDLPHPDLITESGRAMAAHHAVLITDVVDIDRVPGQQMPAPPGDDSPVILQDLWRAYADADQRSPLEVYHDACHWLSEAQGLYTNGLLGLAERAEAERIYHATCRRVLTRLEPQVRAHREVLDELNERLADKLFVNLSLFQSMPDIWAIDQIFPILPLNRLDEPLTSRNVLQDLTCDSDGAIHLYVDRDGVERTLPLPAYREDEPLLLGVFMVGAYQEILGDQHNLFGDTDAVNVVVDGDDWQLSEPLNGDNIEAVLRHVHFDEDFLLQAYRRRVGAAELDESTRAECRRELEAGLQGYTYLNSETTHGGC